MHIESSGDCQLNYLPWNVIEAMSLALVLFSHSPVRSKCIRVIVFLTTMLSIGQVPFGGLDCLQHHYVMKGLAACDSMLLLLSIIFLSTCSGVWQLRAYNGFSVVYCAGTFCLTTGALIGVVNLPIDTAVCFAQSVLINAIVAH